MANQATSASAARPPLQAGQVYGMAVLCLVVGLAIGYLLQGSQAPSLPAQSPGSPAQSQAPPPPQTAGAMPPSASAASMPGRRMPTLAELKQLADKQAAPLLEKLKSDPRNSALLVQVGAIYHSSHQFKEASVYYGKAVDADPGNVADRTKLASSLYRSGDVDGAIAQLNQALRFDPKDANSLFDLGMIRLQGKQDGKGAVAAWQQLLKSNPQLSPDRKTQVQKLMADVLTTLGDQRALKGAGTNDGHK